MTNLNTKQITFLSDYLNADTMTKFKNREANRKLFFELQDEKLILCAMDWLRKNKDFFDRDNAFFMFSKLKKMACINGEFDPDQLFVDNFNAVNAVKNAIIDEMRRLDCLDNGQDINPIRTLKVLKSGWLSAKSKMVMNKFINKVLADNYESNCHLHYVTWGNCVRVSVKTNRMTLADLNGVHGTVYYSDKITVCNFNQPNLSMDEKRDIVTFKEYKDAKAKVESLSCQIDGLRAKRGELTRLYGLEK